MAGDLIGPQLPEKVHRPTAKLVACTIASLALSLLWVKICLDGFSLERFDKSESHFQMGYAIVAVGTYFMPSPNK